jgi:hypothetical protein
MSDATAPSEPTRPTAPTEKAAGAIPIPEADARSRKARTVKIQDILAAHARALDVRLEEGMRDIRLAMDAAVRRTGIHEAPPAPQPIAPYPGAYAPQAPLAPAAAPIREDVARGLAAQTDERFQALSMRLEKIEQALRSATLGGVGGAELDGKLDALAEGVSRFADSEEHLLERFLEAQREGLEDLTRRVGAGVGAVIRALQNELTQTVRRLELTSDGSGATGTDEAIRLERTMMAIAEHQESVLDERLNEIKQSIGVAETAPANGSADRSQKTFD